MAGGILGSPHRFTTFLVGGKSHYPLQRTGALPSSPFPVNGAGGPPAGPATNGAGTAPPSPITLPNIISPSISNIG